MAGEDQPSPWWAPARHVDRRPFLLARREIMRAIRSWFDEQGFFEVETGILPQDCSFELPQSVCWLDAERLDEGTARLLIRSERLRLPSRTVEGKYQQRAQTFAAAEAVVLQAWRRTQQLAELAARDFAAVLQARGVAPGAGPALAAGAATLQERGETGALGGAAAVVAWMVVSIGFEVYANSIATYDTTYGALGTTIVGLIWLWLTNLTLLMGVELDAALERRVQETAAQG